MIARDMARAEVRKLARQGKLMDTAFKAFQRAAYPDAPPDQVAALRVTFFAGAAELHALMIIGADDTSPDEISGDEEEMAFAAFDEVTRFHERTLRLAMQKPGGSA